MREENEEIEWAVSAIRDNPDDCRFFVTTDNVSCILKILQETGSTDTCFHVMKSVGFRGCVLKSVFNDWTSLTKLLDQMVQSDYFVGELATLTLGRNGSFHYLCRRYRDFVINHLSDLPGSDEYWTSLFDYEVSRKDTKRAWDIVTDAFRGYNHEESKYFCASLHTIEKMVNTLYDLMIKKGRLKQDVLVPGRLPTMVKYAVRERRKTRKDRFGRVRGARSYELRGYAPGHHIAIKFRLPGTSTIDIIGQKILAIAACFSKSKIAPL